MASWLTSEVSSCADGADPVNRTKHVPLFLSAADIPPHIYLLKNPVKTFITLLLVTASTFALVACGKTDPGPLAGTWRINGVVPMTVQYREGESEAMGMIEKVTYEINGKDVIVTSKSGPMKGIAARYTVTGTNTVASEFGTLVRIK